jgi:hypothetical protein
MDLADVSQGRSKAGSPFQPGRNSAGPGKKLAPASSALKEPFISHAPVPENPKTRANALAGPSSHADPGRGKDIRQSRQPLKNGGHDSSGFVVDLTQNGESSFLTRSFCLY